MIEGGDFSEDALDPAFDEFGRHPIGPKGVANFAIGHGEIGIAHQDRGVADGGGGGAADKDAVGEGAAGSDPVVGVRGDVEGVARGGDGDGGRAAVAIACLGDVKAGDSATG